MHHLCLEIEDALADFNPKRALAELLDRVEREQTSSKEEVYHSLMSFLPVDGDLDAVLADELDRLRGREGAERRWADEPDLGEGKPPVDVIIGVWRDEGLPWRYLVGRRAGKAYRGCWEFPGGKREPSETNGECLVREWREELGITVAVGKRLFTGRFTTADLTNFIAIAYKVTKVSGTPELKVHTEFAWLTASEILALPPAEVTPSLKHIVRFAT